MFSMMAIFYPYKYVYIYYKFISTVCSFYEEEEGAVIFCCIYPNVWANML